MEVFLLEMADSEIESWWNKKHHQLEINLIFSCEFFEIHIAIDGASADVYSIAEILVSKQSFFR
jgi:hypothetical protein